jgi:hypothetical protein
VPFELHTDTFGGVVLSHHVLVDAPWLSIMRTLVLSQLCRSNVLPLAPFPAGSPTLPPFFS